MKGKATEIEQVLAGQRPWWVAHGEAVAFLDSLPAQSVDLVFFSPPYEKARLYLENGEDMKIARDTEKWVAWLVAVFKASLRVCKGLVACVCEGQTKQFRYSAGPLLLAADLHRAGITLRKPPIFKRVGIPGSGGPDWLRNDYEFIVCATNGGKLPWSDNTACGHPPKWAPGGAMSNRLGNGARVNQWGRVGSKEGMGHKDRAGNKENTARPSHVIVSNQPAGDGEQLFDGEEAAKAATVNAYGMTGQVNASHDKKLQKKQGAFPAKRRVTSGHQAGDTPNADSYDPPALANPGNVHEIIVGGNVMGNILCHQNEAPFPEALPEFYIRSFAPPGGLVVDPFSGSGTTVAMAHKWGRRGLGCDLRESQAELSRKRIAQETPLTLLG